MFLITPVNLKKKIIITSVNVFTEFKLKKMSKQQNLLICSVPERFHKGETFVKWDDVSIIHDPTEKTLINLIYYLNK